MVNCQPGAILKIRSDHLHDLGDPQLSPIYGDLHGFPPAILTSGTRDLFLSNTVRTHRKPCEAGVGTSRNDFHAGQSLQRSLLSEREI